MNEFVFTTISIMAFILYIRIIIRDFDIHKPK